MIEPIKISVKMVGDGDMAVFSENGLKKISVLSMEKKGMEGVQERKFLGCVKKDVKNLVFFEKVVGYFLSM